MGWMSVEVQGLWGPGRLGVGVWEYVFNVKNRRA